MLKLKHNSKDQPKPEALHEVAVVMNYSSST